jgi:hypothetical protein
MACLYVRSIIALRVWSRTNLTLLARRHVLEALHDTSFRFVCLISSYQLPAISHQQNQIFPLARLLGLNSRHHVGHHRTAPHLSPDRRHFQYCHRICRFFHPLCQPIQPHLPGHPQHPARRRPISSQCVAGYRQSLALSSHPTVPHPQVHPQRPEPRRPTFYRRSCPHGRRRSRDVARRAPSHALHCVSSGI